MSQIGSRSRYLSETSPPTTTGERVQAAILATLPTGPGQRHSRIWELASLLRAIGLTDIGEVELILRQWHQLALPAIRTQDWEPTWGDARDAWSRWDPRKLVALDAAVREARQQVPEGDLSHDGRRQLLVAVCAALQRQAGDAAWWLSSHDAGRVLRVPQRTAHRWLRRLEEDGVIECVRRGQPGGVTATRYRFVGGTAERGE
jgi:hypothetical protein